MSSSIVDELKARLLGLTPKQRPAPIVLDSPVDPKRAESLIVRCEAPDGMEVGGKLRLIARNMRTPSNGKLWLPEGMKAIALHLEHDLIKKLPDGLNVGHLTMTKYAPPFGENVVCQSLDMSGTPVEELPADLKVSRRLVLRDCRKLTRLPENLTIGSLDLANCVALKELPRGLSVVFLELQGCTSLRELPADLKLRGGRLGLRDCAWITSLPENMGEVAELDLAGCMNITQLPEGLEVTSWIDIAGTSIRELPSRLDHVGLRWRGVSIPRRVIFEPESLTPDEIFAERNAEVRRVMMERYGYDKLMQAADAEILDQDEDRGGPRRLLRVRIEGDEDLVCVDVRCPSTGHRFFLRVPPTMQTCKQAVAWTAGYDDPGKYDPKVET